MNEKAEHYLSTLERSANTVKTYRRALEKYFDIVGERIDNKAYEDFLAAIKPYSPSTKTILRTAVSGMFDFLEVGGMEKRKHLNRHYLQMKKKEPVNIDEDAISKTVEYCEKLSGELIDLRDKAFVLIAADSGLRISELCSLKRGDVNWKNQNVYVLRKGGSHAFVRLSRRSLSALRIYLGARQKDDGQTGKPINTLPIFITVDGMRKAIKRRMEEAGVDKHGIRIHDFRHFFVTTTLRGSDIKTAKELAGHKNIQVTDRYSHLSEEELDKTYDEIFNKG